MTRTFSTAALVLLLAGSARAEPVSATGKGITGGALLGGEIVVMTEAAVGLESPWWYALGFTVGAGGGAYGGYYVEQNASSELSMYMLLGGMALVIPTSIVYLNAVAFEPEVPQSGDPGGAPPGEPTLDPEFNERLSQRGMVKVPLSRGVMAIDDQNLEWSLPNVLVLDTYTRTEQAELGLTQSPRVLVPVLTGTF